MKAAKRWRVWLVIAPVELAVVAVIALLVQRNRLTTPEVVITSGFVLAILLALPLYNRLRD